MGTCALARNNEDGKYYVIKQVDLTRMNKKERQQSLNEARVLSSLRHPNIINYVDSFLAKKSDHLCIVMEFADGGDISSRIKKNYGVNFRESLVLDWFIQLVLSLHYVHQRKVLHRDVKTQNVFLTSDNVVKLGDFGIARTLSNTYDQAKTFVGTPYYLSPELILERPYDHRSDVWALGVVLYELLTLKHPFNATDMKGLMQRILKVQYDPVPMMYTAEMRDIVPQLLAKDPSQRIELKDILELPIVQQRLRQWLGGEAIPKKYLDTLLKQELLPESALSGVDRNTAEPDSPVADTEESATKNIILPPIATSPTKSSPKAPPPPTSTHTEQLPPNKPSPPAATSSRSPQQQLSNISTGASSSSSPCNRTKQNGDPLPPTVQVVPTQLSAAKPPRKPSSFKHYRSPNPPAPIGALPPAYGARNYKIPYTSRSNAIPSRLSNLDNFYQQLNYYQQGNGRVGATPSNYYRQHPQSHGIMPHYINRNPANAQLGGGVSSRRVGRKRSDSQPNVAYLNPLFRSPHQQLPTPKPSYDAAQSDIKAMLQRAALERAQRRLGNTP